MPARGAKPAIVQDTQGATAAAKEERDDDDGGPRANLRIQVQ